MAVTVRRILDDVRHILVDEGVRWSDSELVNWFNMGQRQIVIMKPDASSRNTTMDLVQGPRQTLPAEALTLLEVYANATPTSSRAIQRINRTVLENERPDWRTEPASDVVRYFTFDEADPRTFYCYPPADTGARIEVNYSVVPTDVDINGDLQLPDIYHGAMVDYIVYRAMSKDAEYAANAEKANLHHQAFIAILGAKTGVEISEAPNLGEQ